MAANKQIRYFEYGMYILIWMAIIFAPFFTSGASGSREWSFIFRGWLLPLPFALVFSINNFLLAPKLLLKGRYWIYLGSCALLIAGAMLVDKKIIRQQMPFFPGHERMEGKLPPRTQGGEINMLPFDGKKTDKPYRPRPPFLGFGLIAISILIVGFNSGTKIFVRWTEEKNTQSEKERQHLITELAYLKNQISPHFFMNTLNNIHALVDIDGEKAKEAIVKLSRLMRYLLYESEDGQVALSGEINFLESYIELMRLRHSESMLSVKMEHPAHLDGVQVPPFLFLSFVENAFKYGINPQGTSAITIRFAIAEKQLLFSVSNQIFTKNETGLKESSGIGLENIKKRLQLIYPNRYTLSISIQNSRYTAELTLPKTT
ncbi:MAG: histidine kinase [Prevotellaceae bacterium]|jgi:hypothetical protein|nr:histidine kinase [Prevotellaceae bacterium]